MTGSLHVRLAPSPNISAAVISRTQEHTWIGDGPGVESRSPRGGASALALEDQSLTERITAARSFADRHGCDDEGNTNGSKCGKHAWIFPGNGADPNGSVLT
ncbi:hypothetical protein Bpla01_25760 [Burkholderia plantarii]|nr:hypothetical protein Bpla01_25760 [Burkholderia plantarii]